MVRPSPMARAFPPRRSVLVPIFIGLALAGSNLNCGDFACDSYTREKPTSGALAGTWALDEAGLDLLRPGGKFKRRPTITLAADGTFTARDIPDWWERSEAIRSGTAPPGLIWRPTSVSGRWNLQNTPDYWAIHLDFRPLPSSSSRIGGVQIDLLGQKPPYRMYASIGDPDVGACLVFTHVR